MTPSSPDLDADAAALVRRVQEEHGPEATSWELLIALIEAWHPSLERLGRLVFQGRDEILARLRDPASPSDDRDGATELRAIPLARAVDLARAEAAIQGDTTATQAHLLLAHLALASGSPARSLDRWRPLLRPSAQPPRDPGSVPQGWTRPAPPDRTLARYRAGEALVRSPVLPGGEMTMPLARRSRGTNRLTERMGPLLWFTAAGHGLAFEGWWRSGLGHVDPLVPEMVFGHLMLELPGGRGFILANALTGTADGPPVGMTGSVSVSLHRADATRTEAAVEGNGLAWITPDGRHVDEVVDLAVTLWASAR